MKPATPDSRRDVTTEVVARRRLVALAGHKGDPATARRGLDDASPLVRVTALGALKRLGSLSDSDLEVALLDGQPAVRRRAAELAGQRPAIDLTAALGDEDPGVTEMAAWAAGEQEQRRYVPQLTGLVTGSGKHEDPLCREAAVAALGAIGDEAGLPAVLLALEDKPAVRRRAAVALAAFDGPEVTAALERALGDRDWQVRQVAEDLLEIEQVDREGRSIPDSPGPGSEPVTG